MGYILPIQQHEYADYQRRMVTKKRTITSVEKSYKTDLRTKYEELKHGEEIRNQSLEVIPPTKEILPSYADMEEVFTEITGIGHFVNERV